MTIYVIEDHPLIREGMTMMFRRMRAGVNVAEMSTLGELESAVQLNGPPELICLDLSLGDTDGGVSAVERVRKNYPDVPLAVVSGSSIPDIEEQCLEAGADIYLDKKLEPSLMISTLRSIVVQPSEETESSEGDMRTLSKRQQELLVMLDLGLNNREIGEKLGISEHTIKVHLWRLFKRLKVKSRMQTLTYARANGLLPR
jgi:DNA-binding NarL/FixJ family response regulator